MIDVTLSRDNIQKIYGYYSRVYFFAHPFERKAKLRGIELASIQPGDKVLEVAVGIGNSFLEIIKKVAPDNIVQGVDLTPEMLTKTRKRIKQMGKTNFNLQQADARCLPFQDNSFDVVYNSFMLDLLPLTDLPVVMGEFQRVLKPGGRLITISFSKKSDAPNLYEKIYKKFPSVMGGCRPVLMEKYFRNLGFESIKREFIPFPVPSEIIFGRK